MSKPQAVWERDKIKAASGRKWTDYFLADIATPTSIPAFLGRVEFAQYRLFYTKSSSVTGHTPDAGM